jgi:hypothetical protein
VTVLKVATHQHSSPFATTPEHRLHALLNLARMILPSGAPVSIALSSDGFARM